MYGEDGVMLMNNQMNENRNNNASVTASMNRPNTNNAQVNNSTITNLTGINGHSKQTANANLNPGMKVQSGAIASGVARKKVLLETDFKNDKYTENWLNIKAISNGIIYNDRNEMVTGVKIQPKNIFILDNSVMDNTLRGLMNFYNTIDYEFWLMVVDRPVDIAMYQAELQLLYNKTTDQRIRKLISQDIDKGDYFTNNNVVDTEYYLLFKEKRMDVLQKKVRNLINGYASCGLIASQTTTDDLRMVVDNLLNGGKRYDSGSVRV